MIGANSLRRRFNYFRRDAISESRWSSDRGGVLIEFSFSAFLRAHLVVSLSLPSLRITLYFQISGQSSSSIGILRCISGFAVDDTSRPSEEMTKRIPDFYYPFRSPAPAPLRNCLFAGESNRLSWKKYFRVIEKEGEREKNKINPVIVSPAVKIVRDAAFGITALIILIFN